jgi:hypothetical protein
MQRYMQLIGLGRQQHFQPFCHRTQQNRLAILWAENEVIFEKKDSASIVCIPLMFHIKGIALCSINHYLLRIDVL